MKEVGPKKSGRFERLMVFLNIISIASILLCYLAGIISPRQFWPLAFVGMGYPLMLAITAFFTLFWLLKRKWWLFLNIAVVLVKWDYVQETVQFRKNSASELTDGFKVMSFNVRLFDYFNWSGDTGTRQKAFEFLASERPDILCTQEFYINEDDDFPTMDTVLLSNNIRHAHIENYRDNRTDNTIWGMATFSAFPIVNKGVINFTSTYGNRCIYTDLKIGSDTVRVYNVHLQSVRIGEDQYLFLDQLMLTKSMKGVPIMKLLGDLKLLVYRMAHGFIERGKQADQVAKHVETCPYPTILCGDFNDTPTSYAYQRLRNGFSDSFIENGTGVGATYVRIPGFRIDNIFYDSHFSSGEHTVHHEKLSDHYAISSRLRLK